ncbi:MAG: hypothetical protein M1826_005820 [Phylliscum demangeonii]|nr:MAG: hypothetical protein M1826_005820 [Phylliscum demangeonii]
MSSSKQNAKAHFRKSDLPRLQRQIQGVQDRQQVNADQVDKRFSNMLEVCMTRQDEMMAAMNRRFDRLDEKLDRLDVRLDRVEERLHRVDAGQVRQEEKMDQVNAQLDQFHHSLTCPSTKASNMTMRFNNRSRHREHDYIRLLGSYDPSGHLQSPPELGLKISHFWRLKGDALMRHLTFYHLHRRVRNWGEKEGGRCAEKHRLS